MTSLTITDNTISHLSISLLSPSLRTQYLTCQNDFSHHHWQHNISPVNITSLTIPNNTTSHLSISLFSPSLKMFCLTENVTMFTILEQFLPPENVPVLTIPETVSPTWKYHCSYHPWNSFSHLKISLFSPSLKEFLPPENIPSLTIPEKNVSCLTISLSHHPWPISLAWQYPCPTIPDQYILPDDIPGISVNRSGGDDSNHGCKKATLTMI